MIGYNRAHCPCNLHATVAKPHKCRAIEVLKTATGASPIAGSNPTLSVGSNGVEVATFPWDENFHDNFLS
jgi:hypothetical protein